MSFVAVAGVATAGIGAATSLSLAAKQRKEAQRLANIPDPGIQPNYALSRTSQILGDQYSNFQLPGFTRYQEQIASGGASAMQNAIQGASSSEDILAAASRIQGVENDALQGLYTQQAGGKLNALNQWLNSINAVGNDQVRMNNIELDRYDQVLRQAETLRNSATQNSRVGLDDLLTGVSGLARNFMPNNTVDPNTGDITRGKSIYQTYFGK